jgi:hypothetical protein
MQLTHDKELLSDWYVVKGSDDKPLRVTVPDDLYVYAVDQQALENTPQHPRNYKGMNANVSHDSGRQAVIQVHRWMKEYELTRGRDTNTFAVGDWVVGERMFAYRGEYLGVKRVPTHVPIWSVEQSTFVLAGRPPTRGADRRPTQEVQFIDARRAPLLVDFEGGTVTYRRGGSAAPKNEDGTTVEGAKATPATDVRFTGAATEVLLLTPDGKLLAHNSAEDEMDEARKERLKKYDDRVSEAEGKSEAPTPGKPGGDPFGDKR